MLDPGLILGPEFFQQGAELGLGRLEAAGGLDLTPGFFEGGVILQAELALRVA